MSDPTATTLSSSQAKEELKRAPTFTANVGLTVRRASPTRPAPQFVPLRATPLVASVGEKARTTYPGRDFFWSLEPEGTTKATLSTTTGPSVSITGVTQSDLSELSLTCKYTETAATEPDWWASQTLRLTVSEYFHRHWDLFTAIKNFSGDLCGAHLYGFALTDDWKVADFPEGQSPVPAAPGAPALWLSAIEDYLKVVHAMPPADRPELHATVDWLWKQLKHDTFEPAFTRIAPEDRVPSPQYDLVARPSLEQSLADWATHRQAIAAEQRLGFPPTLDHGYYHLGFKWFQLAGLYVRAVKSALERPTSVSVTWSTDTIPGSSPPATLPVKECTEGPGGPAVRAIKYVRGSTVKLDVVIGLAAPRFPYTAVSATATVKHRGSRTEYTIPGTIAFTGDTASFRVEVDPMLRALAVGPNVNHLTATVTLALGVLGHDKVPISRTVSTLVPLHLMLQKMVLFLPGVLGSSVRVQSVGTRWGWPCVAPGTEDFAELACDRNGFPLQDASAVELTRVIAVGPKRTTVYAPEVFQDRLLWTLPELHLDLHANGAPFRYYVVAAWPYDWRRRCDDAVARLLDGTGFGAGSGSIEQIVAQLREHGFPHPFPMLHDKVALAGHSTGGVIMKNALVQEGVRDHVDQAFFINVPFQGAVKAYFVYLTGEMLCDLPQLAQELVLDPDVMIKIAPNAPIVYYLSPTKAYTKSVCDQPGMTGSAMRRRSEMASVGNDLIRPLRSLLGSSYPEGLDDWNDQLERDAHAFHSYADERTPLIGLENCVVCYSTTTPAETPGAISIAIASGNVRSSPIAGDGTVPLESLLGYHVGEVETYEIPNHHPHAEAPNEPELWDRIRGWVSAFVSAPPGI